MSISRDDRQTEEQTLITRAQHGCAESFDELMRGHQARLVHYFRQRVTNHQDAEDLAQDTFLRVYDHLARYRSTYPFKAWLFTIARRLLIDRYRRRSPRGESFATAESLDTDSDPARIAEYHEQRGNLWRLAANILSESQFTALWLFYVEEMGTGEIAKVIGSTRIAVKTSMHRARAKLRKQLESEEDHQVIPSDVKGHAEMLLRRVNISSG